eukprot:TRINITY_DN15122_c0_g4_i1.p1 TRINITY_DN15122_c0_g4~~TRINITY_DN15122_c0_g4_i1.p1  ORF type:complete len:365 (-),score=60.54 TRINITY_DN15122_c0_g4_i1:98-1192(-)
MDLLSGCLSGRSRSSQNDLGHRCLVGILRTSSMYAPRNISALRFVCDTAVPKLLLRRDVAHDSDEVLVGGVSLRIEWVTPVTSPRSSRSTCSGSPLSTPGNSDADDQSSQWSFFTIFSPFSQLQPRQFNRVVLYLHGGAYLLCTPGSLRGITYEIAGGLAAPCCVPEYRRPPEHPIPAPLEDAMAAYRHLLETMPGAEIVLAGESAGGGIAAAMLSHLRETDLPPPSCCILISPWTDLGGNGLEKASLENEATDYLPPDLVGWCAKQARGDLHEKDWRVSPVHVDGDLKDLPPMMVCYGRDELLCGQVAHFCEVWASKGAKIRERPVEGGVHAPILFQSVWEPAEKALLEMVQFVEDCSRSGTP